jgi:hypothetical protein
MTGDLGDISIGKRHQDPAIASSHDIAKVLEGQASPFERLIHSELGCLGAFWTGVTDAGGQYIAVLHDDTFGTPRTYVYAGYKHVSS